MATHGDSPQSSLSEADLRELFRDALKGQEGLEILKGFKLDLSANRDFHKLFFATRCGCGTSALLSVEIGQDKTLPEVQAALPELLGHLRSREQAFRDMSCDMHAQMRIGGRTGQPEPRI